MLDLAATALLAPALVAAATLTARRFGPRAGGVVSGFPAIVGPVLLIDVLEHGGAFTARAAAGTLLGLIALAAFVAVYGLLAPRAGWRATVLAAWATAAAAGTALAGVDAGPFAASVAAGAALAATALVLPRAAPAPPRTVAATRGDLPLRMAASAALVVVLAVAAGVLGPVAGGLLAALPVLASVLAVFTHRREGARATVALLRGMVGGMGGFVAFCLGVALLVEPAGPAAAFAAATAAAVAAQLVAASWPRRSLRAWTSPPPSAASSPRSASPARRA